MPRLTRHAAGAATITVLCVVLTGCASAETNQAEACEQADETRQAVQQLRDLDVRSATGDDARDAVENAGDELSQLRGAVDDVADDRIDEVENSLAELRATLEGLGGQPLTEARASIEAALQNVATTWDAAWTSLDCE
jgi:hypothetical protein